MRIKRNETEKVKSKKTKPKTECSKETGADAGADLKAKYV